METKNEIYDNIRNLKKKFDELNCNTSLLILRNIRETRKNDLVKLEAELTKELEKIERALAR